MQNDMMNFAHRGVFSRKCPENSLGAFSAAIEKGIGIELDVRLSSDKVPMVFHDRTMKRMCGDRRAVSSLTAKKLSKIRLGNSNETIPTLKEVLELVDGRVPLLIELKMPRRHVFSKRLERKTLALLRDYKGEYLIQSFNRWSVRYMKRRLPDVHCGILSGNRYPQPKHFDFISYRMKDLTPHKMKELRRKYPFVIGWISGNMTMHEAMLISERFGLDGAVL